jgi:glycerophosphoryl diester phosphodiesterase
VIELRRRDGAPPLVIGHRGAGRLAPENTLASVERALEAGVDLVEIDVVRLADGALVLAHSDDLAEVSHGAGGGRVGARGLDELRRLAPSLATLEEALALLAGGGAGLLLDLKERGYEAEAAAALRRHGLVERALVSSVFRDSLLRAGAAEPGLRLGLTYPYDRRGISRRRALAPAVAAALLAMRLSLPPRIGRRLERAGATAATLHHLVISRPLVARCHARGAAVIAWTVDDPRTARRLARLGVDGIVTDDPLRVSAATLAA